MLDVLKPSSITVRYGTTIATCGRALANGFLMSAEPVYAAFALSSNAVGLTASHTKAGVTAECGLAICGLTALSATAIANNNMMQLWMATVGMVAFGNAFLNNVQYTKLCPNAWRKSEEKDKIDAANKILLPQDPYEQEIKTKKSFFVPLKNLTPQYWLRKGADALANSTHDGVQKFGRDAQEITQRKMFSPGVTALIGVTPFIIDGVQQGLETGNWSRAIGGSLIFLANTMSMFSIPQKQKHPILALVDELKKG